MRPGPIACFAVLILSTPGRAATIRVPAHQPTIQAGIDAANVGDTVLVAPGTYVESIYDGFNGKDLVLRSEAGPESTAIYAIDMGISFGLGESPAAEVDGFTIRDGFMENAGGAGMQISNSSPTIKNCIVRHCRAVSNYQDISGGAIIIYSGSPLFTTASYPTISPSSAVSRDMRQLEVGCTAMNPVRRSSTAPLRTTKPRRLYIVPVAESRA